MNRPKGSSRRVRAFSANPLGSSLKGSGRQLLAKPLNPKQIALLNAATQKEVLNGPSKSLDIPDHLDHHDDSEWQSDSEPSQFDLFNVLEGDSRLDISHAGGEFQGLQDDAGGISSTRRRRRKDNRTRRDRLKRQSEGFESQYKHLVPVYMQWHALLNGASLDHAAPPLRPPPSPATEVNSREVQVFDVFRAYFVLEDPEVDRTPVCALIRHGLIPNAPWKPQYAVTIRVLEFYRTTHLRCPHLAIEPFMKSLCDIYGVSYRTSLRDIFSTCYDVYLRLRDETQNRVLQSLGRGGLWRRRHACPACTYRLKGESKLLFSMLVTMDGNDSLKRIIRRVLKDLQEPDDGTGTTEAAPSIEREDGRCHVGAESYYIPREKVDKFARDRVDVVDASGENKEGDEGMEDSPCAGRWQNMKKEATSKAWGIFDETGIFLSLCRHGFVLAIADMVKSGELSKYPLAVVEALIEAFGDDIGCGYDIGCRFSTTLRQSVLGPQAKKANFRSLVGSFHGHAHNRLCQLSNLAAYVEGLGIEDLEGCERFFSKSNALARSLRYASPFHRNQKIIQYIQHTDEFETSQNLSKFLVNNYKQALSILQGEEELKKSMIARGYESTVIFHQWLAEEHEYLTNLSKEPLEETLQMDYYQKLVNLDDLAKTLKKTVTTFVVYDPSLPSQPKGHGGIIIKRRNDQENYDKTLAVVQDLELKLNIKKRWTNKCDEWKAAAVMVSRKRYQRCLDELERLVVSRMFELTKMNMSQTGYKLRKHIAKALQARSKAIRAALDRYNTAAAALTPPRPSLTWDQVVEYAFLADFDLLRDTRQDIRDRPWARPLNRALMDKYFKIQRAGEEIERLNIEIKRVVTHIQDEENFLAAREEAMYEKDPILAFHIANYRIDRTRFFPLHLRRFSKLLDLAGFTGNILPGSPLNTHTTDAPLQILSAASRPPPPEDDRMAMDDSVPLPGAPSSGSEDTGMAVDTMAHKRPTVADWEDDEDETELAEDRHQDDLDLDEEGDIHTAVKLLSIAEDNTVVHML
ncbi:hypothetical protein DFP72DRAFT_830402 [Ephemerocybe angulata]|uniref:Uncharacterized protein n=1 Tax=Ephemerocybe angulata TaxID=980116 RepID=A0A8H6H8V1_9AGAR|nr:hypothetical protein DFP72DRAFT_830402 [Tulosesus angulatus]